jgi:hypothetical protein
LEKIGQRSTSMRQERAGLPIFPAGFTKAFRVERAPLERQSDCGESERSNSLIAAGKS